MQLAKLPLQARLAVTLAAILSILGIAWWVQEERDRWQAERTRGNLATEHTALLAKLSNLLGSSLHFIASDYAPWDEMVRFVAQPDAEWGRVNIHEPLGNFKIDAVWVLNLAGEPVFATTRGDDPALHPLHRLPLPAAAVDRLLAGKEPLHCFVESPIGLLELRAEPVRPAAQINQFDVASGWFIAAEIWDEERLKTLADLLDASLTLAPPDAPEAAAAPTHMSISLPLRDWQGRPLRQLQAVFTTPALQSLAEDRVQDLTIFALCSLAVLVTMLASTYKWFVRPLRRLTLSLASRDPAHLRPLASTSREFNELGRIVERSFAQEKELRQAFAAFNAIDDAVLILDTATQQIGYVNSGATRLFGRPREELLSARFDQLVQPETEGHGPGPASAGPAATLNYARVIHRDGRRLDIEFRRQELPVGNDAPRSVVVARDISERRAQEKQRLRAQRLEGLGALAGGVAHDLNNMLTPVSLMLDDLATPGSRPDPDLIASVRVSVRRGASMLRQLLMFGRGVEGERNPVSVADLCADLGRIIHSTFPKSIESEVLVPPDIGHVIGDATQLHQVLLNLCVNARDAMPGGGRLRLRATPLTIGADNLAHWPGARRGEFIVLEVSDTGTGIPPELLERVFEPFFTTKTADKGSGLGLSTSLGIVRGHRGSITVQSAAGQGTTFRVALPAAPPAAPVPAAAAAPAFSGAGRTLLIVEDEAIVLDVILGMLRQAKFTALTATDGTQGLAAFADRRDAIDVVVTDLSMPGMDGLEMTRRIRELSPDTPVLVMSGRVDDAARARMAALGLGPVLNKPFTRSEFFSAIERLLAAPTA